MRREEFCPAQAITFTGHVGLQDWIIDKAEPVALGT